MTTTSPASVAPATWTATPPHRLVQRPRRVSGMAVGVSLGVIAALLIAVYLGICAYMALTVTKPERVAFTSFPEQFGLRYESVSFPSRVDQIRLEGWYLLPAPTSASSSAKRPVVVVHGRSSDRQRVTRDHNALPIAAHLVSQGHAVLLFDLRGSGRSGGERFTLGAQEVRDVGGAVDYLDRRGFIADGVSLLSYSMGAATAMLYAPTDPRVRSVVEDSGYGALGDVLEDQVPKLSGLPWFFTPGVVLMGRPLMGVDAYAIRPIESVKQLAARRTPLFIIHGDADQTVPFRHAAQLAGAYASAAGGGTAETYYVAGAKHVGSYEVDPATYLSRVSAFLSR